MMGRYRLAGSTMLFQLLLVSTGCGMGDAGARASMSGEDATPGTTAEDTPLPGRPPITEADRAAIEEAATSYVLEETAIEDVTVEIEVMAEEWARTRILPPGGATDPATLYMMLEDGAWRGVVIGTAFTPQDLDDVGVPMAVRPQT